jgi:undecaprenyl-diphosphatase
MPTQDADFTGGPAPAPDRPRWLLWAIAAIAVGTLLLVIVGAAIDRGHQFRIDRALLLALRQPGNTAVPIGPHWIEAAMIDVTALGGTTVLTLIVTVTGIALAIERRWLTLALVLGATIGGSIAVDVAKTLVGRARPDIVAHLVQVSSLSFPSGHSANSAIVYLTLATLLAQIIRRRALRRFVLAVAILLAIAIGCSRVYLGVHWPSDVLAGWSFGALWALAWWAIGARIRRKRAAT